MKQIIIADDSATARLFVRRCLEIAGCRNDFFIEASHGEEVLAAMENHKVDLIVTDINMPVMDGVELLKRLRADLRWASVPVLVITSTQNQAKDAELMALKATAVLAKPISPPRVAEILKKF